MTADEGPQPAGSGHVSVSCREVVGLVTELFDRALSDRDRRLVEEHLAGCPECSVFVGQIRTTIGLCAQVGATTRVRVSDERVAVLVSVLRRRRGVPTSR